MKRTRSRHRRRTVIEREGEASQEVVNQNEQPQITTNKEHITSNLQKKRSNKPENPPESSLPKDFSKPSSMSSTSKPNVIHLDGRTLEGGGQLLRNAICVSALTGTAVHITNIRGNRSGGGGLKAQHLAGVRWLAQACEAHVEGDEKGSAELVFVPGGRRRNQDKTDAEGEGGKVMVLPPAFWERQMLEDGREVLVCRPLKMATAGSTGLALQAVLPYLLFFQPEGGRGVEEMERLPMRLTVHGGTNVSGSPSFEYVKYVLLPTLRRIGLLEMSVTLDRRAWSSARVDAVGGFTIEIAPRGTRTGDDGGGLGKFDLGLGRQLADPLYEPEMPSEIHGVMVGPSTGRELFQHALEEQAERYFGSRVAIQSDDPRTARLTRLTFEQSLSEHRIYILLIATIPAPTDHSQPGNSPASTPTHALLAADILREQSARKPINLPKTITEMTTRAFGALAREWRSNAVVDEHMRDQLIIFQALAHGRSGMFGGWEVEGKKAGQSHGEEAEGTDPSKLEQRNMREISLHARTAEWVCKTILSAVEGDDGRKVKFDADGWCDGYGFGRAEE
jgi:RNA 3'-terminal phosphate cyclase (ATP)